MRHKWQAQTTVFWEFEYHDGDPTLDETVGLDVHWERGLPSMTGKQLAAFAMWLVTSDPPGIASPHHPGRCDVR